MGGPMPPVLCPDAGSGFDEDPPRPTVRMQGVAMILRGLSDGRGNAGPVAPWAKLGVVAILSFTFEDSYLRQRHCRIAGGEL